MKNNHFLGSAAIDTVSRRAFAAALVPLTDLEQRLIDVLLDTRTPLPDAELAERTYAGRRDGGPDSALSIMKVMILRLRRRGFNVVNYHGIGYVLERRQPATRARLESAA